MKKTALLLVFILLSALICLPAGAQSLYQMGDVIDDFSVTTPQGETLTLHGLLQSHKAVLINFWFVDCPWCVYEFPFLQSAYEEANGEVAVLALTPYDSNDAIAAFQQDNSLTFPMAQDTIGLSARFGCTGYPTTIMIDRNGVYCFSRGGAFSSAGEFKRLISAFTADDYSDPLVDFVIPAAAPPADAPSGEALSAALNAQGSSLVFRQYNSAGIWPWLIREENGRSYAFSSNSYEDATSALIGTQVTVQAGDALSFDYLTDSGRGDDVLVLFVNDTAVKVFSGQTGWQTYAHAFAEAGEYEILFAYMKTASVSTGSDLAAIDHVQLLTGAAAQEALSRNPVYPRTLAGSDVAIDVLNEGARRVIISDASGTLDRLYPNARYYITPGSKLQVRIRIGQEIDPEAALVHSHYANSAVSLSSLSADEVGYTAEYGMHSRTSTGYAWSALLVYPLFNNYEVFEPLFYFASEDDLDFFCAYNISANASATWAYADGTAAYTLRFVDQDGSAVPGVIANICDETTCTPMFADENGLIAFEKAPYPYDIHVISIPEGYAFDMAQGYTAPAAGGEMTFTLTRQ